MTAKKQPMKTEYIFDDIQSKYFVHNCYLQRKAKQDEPQRFAKVKEAISALEDAVKIDREIFEELIVEISHYGWEGEKSFLAMYDYNVDYTAYRAKICKLIFSNEFKAQIEGIHSFSCDYFYDAIALTREEPMDGYIEALKNYLKFRKEPESFQIEFSEEDLDWLDDDVDGVTHLLATYPKCYLLFPKQEEDPFQIEKDTNGLTITVQPCADNFDAERFAEQLLVQIAGFQYEHQEGTNISHTSFEKKCFQWLQKRAEEPKVDLKGLLGRFLGLWMWDNKRKTGGTLEDTAYDCQSQFPERYKNRSGIIEDGPSLDVLEGYYKWATRCISSGEVENAK
ncbi:protein of unknown function [Pseudodesulfovibrio profundus]|uniref:Uncharacterized protein n=1 Tax=Pseudodesulfovibrio profundus TaxID=57320 RepID=A0A2C8F8J2_9BACT|nr:hypothetical protein [Pseudodesulfovibrio profundus]SOB58950.1 protein of unknown function [Pseudodesulfovibrio profundus]